MMNEPNIKQADPAERAHAWDPEQYERAAGFVAGELGADLVDWLGAERFAGRRVLDLGCGDGDLSQRLGALGADVLGVDSSETMVAAACARGIQARVHDARDAGELARKTDGEAPPIDTVFTNATLHWIADKDRVVAGVRRILKPGGVFAGEFGGAGCVALIREAIRDAARELFGSEVEPRFPWHFIGDAEFRAILEAQGFRVRRILMFERRPALPEGIVGWLETFGATIFEETEVAPAQRGPLWEATQAKLEQSLYYDGEWHADYVRLRFEATVA